MTGLEKILAQIKSDSDNTCRDIKNKATAQCEAIIAEAQSQADAILKEGSAKVDRAKDEVLNRAKFTADLEARKVMLCTKQQIVTSALSNAREYICSLPEDEYFDLICKMLAKYSEPLTGTVCLSAKDLGRLPADFTQKLAECSKGDLTLSKEPANIDGGFILQYGGIEVNCAFSSIFSAEAERFSDEVSDLLFA